LPRVQIIYASAAAKVLRRLPRNQAERITAAIDRLPEGDVKRLQGRRDYRLRVGDWRVIFDITGETMTIQLIATRGGVYKG
jgi:mRNA interferase RelE/StbE